MVPSTILVATDFSDIGRRAADWAADLARVLGARLIVAHAFDIPVVGVPDGAFIVDAKTAAQLSDQAQRGLDAEVERLRGHTAGIEGMLRQGDPREAILAAAEAAGATLIVVGSHGRRGLSRALLGSVAETVVRTSRVPVAVVRTPA